MDDRLIVNPGVHLQLAKNSMSEEPQFIVFGRACSHRSQMLKPIHVKQNKYAG